MNIQQLFSANYWMRRARHRSARGSLRASRPQWVQDELKRDAADKRARRAAKRIAYRG